MSCNRQAPTSIIVDTNTITLTRLPVNLSFSSLWKTLLAEGATAKLSPPASPITGFTIGPRSNTSLSPTAYLDDIAALIAQAFSHGWIDNSGIVTSLGQKLQAVRRALTRGNAKEAANKLTAFMHEVEAQQGKHLTSEAYALLFFNAQYLRAHL